MIKTEIIKGAELPYRIEIDGHLHGASQSPREAAIVALSVGGLLPFESRNEMNAAGYIFWNFKANAEWAYLVRILEKNTFDRFKECKYVSDR